MAKKNKTRGDSEKIKDLEQNRVYDNGTILTTNHGVKINDNQNSLKTGARGGTANKELLTGHTAKC